MAGVARKVLSFSSGQWITCAWADCGRPAYELYKAVFHEHARELPCDSPRSEHINFIFCTERHKQYFANSHVNFGQLPAGYAKSI
jgi:hypothetical protein